MPTKNITTVMWGEPLAGRWAIGKCKPFVYGGHFLWLCGCDTVKYLLNYDAPVQQHKRWKQELMGHNFTVLCRSSKFMKDVDAMNHPYGDKLIQQCMVKSASLHQSSL
jgi:hypothetical protein